MAREFALPSQTGNAGKVLTTDGTNVSWGAGGGGGSVVTDGTTIGGNGSSGSPIASLQGSYGPIAITGTVNGTNLVFTIPSGVIASTLQIFDGTQYQTQGALPNSYQVSGTTVTFNTGKAPTVGLTAFGATTPTAVASGTLSQGSVGISIGGAGSVISTGLAGIVRVPYNGTITGYYLTSTISGSCVIDVWKTTFSGYPATSANSIAGSDLPTLSSSNKASDITLTGWTTNVSAGDYIFFNVNSATTVTNVQLQLTITKS